MQPEQNSPAPARKKSPGRNAERTLKLQKERNERRLARMAEMLNRAGRWYVLLVPPQREQIAERILERLGFDSFVPVEFRWRRVNSRQKVRRYVPYIMASRYVFVGFPSTGRIPWYDLFKTGIVRGVLRVADGNGAIQPLELPASTIRSLIERTGEVDARQSAVKLNRGIVPGDTVVVTKGPWAGFSIRIDGIDRGKIKAVVDVFARATPLEIPLDHVEAF